MKNILIRECGRKNIRTGFQVSGVNHSKQGFHVFSENYEIRSERLIIATGGSSYPKTGSKGDGYNLANSLGHNVIKPEPGLTPLEIKDNPFSELQGVSVSVDRVILYRMGKKVYSLKGDLLFTKKGLSGPVILDLSLWVKPGDELEISFLNNASVDQFKNIHSQGKKTISGFLREFRLASRLNSRLCYLAEIEPDCKCATINSEQRQKLADLYANYRVKIDKLDGFETAMVTKGGVCTDEIDPSTMESRLVKGLFFAGEVIDIAGICGGYNLQAAFSTGFLAGINH